MFLNLSHIFKGDSQQNSGDISHESNEDSSQSSEMPVTEDDFNKLQSELVALQQQLASQRNGSSSSGDSSQNNSISAVAEVKLSPFLEADPELWFVITEAHFTARQITADKTKYFHTVSHLPSSVAMRIKDVIMAPYENGNYEKLKKELIAIFSESATEKFERLISNEPFGDMKPSQALHKIKGFAAGSVQDDFVKKLWMKRLPQTTRTVLAASSDSLDNLAKMADSMWEVSDRSSIASIGQVSTVEKTLQSLQEQMKRLTQHVFSSDDRKSRRDSTPHNRNRTRSKSNKNAQERESDNGVCWYHRKYNEQATKCRSPCSFEKN